MVIGGEEVPELLFAAIAEAGHQEHGRDPLLHEPVMIGAGEQALLGQRVLDPLHVHSSAGPIDDRP